MLGWDRLIKRLKLSPPVWDDMRITPGAFQFGGGSDPTISDWQPGGSGATFKVFKFLKDDEVFALIQIPHKYKEGTDLHAHLHWTPGARGNEEADALVGWKVDYSAANINGTFGASGTLDLSSTCSGTDHKHEVSPEAVIDGTGLLISAMIALRIYRSDTGADDTWAGATAAVSPAMLEFDIHYQIDTLGSRQELTK